MECLAYYTDATGNIHSKKINCIKFWNTTGFKYFPPTKENVQKIEYKTSSGDSIVINEFNELFIVPTRQIDIEENIVQLIAFQKEVWYKRQNVQIVHKRNLFKTLTQFLQLKFYSSNK